MEAVIYTRVSHLHRSVSVRDQEKECRRVCEINEWPVRAVFSDDGISASRYSTKDRPAWEALKSELREGDVLVVWEASRAHRDLDEWVALRSLCSELNVPLSYSGRILNLTEGDDRFIGTIDAAVAERESELIKARTLRGKRTAAEAGRPAGRPPWGYRNAVEKKTGTPIRGVWEFDPVEAPRVKEAVRRFLKGESLRSIMRWLQETPGWTPSGMTGFRRALTNPALAGLRVHQGEVHGKGTWEPLITEAEHRRVVAKVQGLKRAQGYAARPGPEPKYLLSGIARCGQCETPLEHKKFRKRSDAYVCPKGHCCRAAGPLEKLVEKKLLERLSKIDPSEYHSGDDPEVQKALDEIAEIEEEIEEWIAAAGRREVSHKAFIKIEQELQKRIAALRPKTVSRSRGYSAQELTVLASRWSGLPLRQKRDIIRAFLTVKLYPFERPVLPCSRCENPKVYARGVCKACYLKAWRGLAPMPPRPELPVGRVVVERI